MYISKSRFINWTRCPMYFPMDLKHNPRKMDDIDAECERRLEAIGEMVSGVTVSERFEDDEEVFDAKPGEELEALMPFYNQVEAEALKVAKKYFCGTFVGDSKDVHNQKIFEYEHGGHTYRCYVDIYNENDEEINIIEVKATTNSKFAFTYDMDGKPKGLFFADKWRGGNRYPLFVKEGNIWHLNYLNSTINEYAEGNFKEKKKKLLNRYADEGKYPHDLAFQRFVIEHALRKAGDTRKVNYYLAVLNSEYVYDGTKDVSGACIYENVNGQELITFIDMNETTESYQPMIAQEVAMLESYIRTPHDISQKCEVGNHCAWGKNTECVFWKHCYQKLRLVPDSNSSNKYIHSGNTVWGGMYGGKYALVNAGLFSLGDIDVEWLKNESHSIQRDCYDGVIPEYVDKEKMLAWFDHLEYPIYHFDFEAFPCPLPLFKGENPYRQSVFEFSLHIEREPGVCDKDEDNYVFLNNEFGTDERKALAKAIVDHFEFNDDGTLHGTMLAQNTNYERERLKELAELYPEYGDKLLAIRDKAADLIHLLNTDSSNHNSNPKKIGLYEQWGFSLVRCNTINYYHKELSGSYSIKRTLPVLVSSLSYDDMKKHAVGNGVQAYVTYLNYDAPAGTTRDMDTKEDRREALRLYCQQDTWAMVEILRAVREKIM